MISTDNSGVACCGNCGGHVVVACSSGCAEPDVQFRDDHIASLPVPRKNEARAKKVPKYPPPTHCKCGAPVAKRAKHGVGRPPTKCEKHIKRKAAK